MVTIYICLYIYIYANRFITTYFFLRMTSMVVSPVCILDSLGELKNQNQKTQYSKHTLEQLISISEGEALNDYFNISCSNSKVQPGFIPMCLSTSWYCMYIP